MINATFKQVDKMYRLNPKFRQTIICSYYGQYGHDNNDFIYIHAKNARFELVVDTMLIDEWDDFNYLTIDGVRHSLNEYDSLEQVEAEINKRL